MRGAGPDRGSSLVSVGTPALEPAPALGPAPALASVLSLALLALGGCGFHLAGSARLPAQLAVVRLETNANPQSEFFHELQRRLSAAGTRLSEDATEVAPVVRVLEDGYGERVLTVSALNVPTTYQISYTVRIAVNSGAQELLPAESHVLTRDYSFNEATLLAKEREREVLVEALAHDLADVVVQRLASL